MIETLPEVTDGIATARFRYEPTLASDHTGVTAGSLPTSLIASAMAGRRVRATRRWARPMRWT